MAVVRAELVREIIPTKTSLEVLAEAADIQGLLDNVHNREVCWLTNGLIYGELRCSASDDDKEWQIYEAEAKPGGKHRIISWVKLNEPAKQEIIKGFRMVFVPINLQKVINAYREQQHWVVLPPEVQVAYITLPYNKKQPASPEPASSQP